MFSTSDMRGGSYKCVVRAPLLFCGVVLGYMSTFRTRTERQYAWSRTYFSTWPSERAEPQISGNTTCYSLSAVQSCSPSERQPLAALGPPPRQQLPALVRPDPAQKKPHVSASGSDALRPTASAGALGRNESVRANGEWATGQLVHGPAAVGRRDATWENCLTSASVFWEPAKLW